MVAFISRLFSKKKANHQTDDEKTLDATTEGSKSLHQNDEIPPELISVEIDIHDEMLLAPGLSKTLKQRGEEFWRMGHSNGTKGVDPTNESIKSIAKARAVLLVETIQAVSQGKLRMYKSDALVKRSILEDEEDRYRDVQSHLETMMHEHHLNPKAFSVLLSILYLLIALFLIFADVPLATVFIEQGFNLKELEGLLLSVGISLCAVYIKIYYDDYIGTPIGYYVTQFKKIPNVIGNRQRKKALEENDKRENAIEDKKSQKNHALPIVEQGQLPNDSTPESDSSSRTTKADLDQSKKIRKELVVVKLEYWVKFILKTFFLLFTLYTVWVLGEFRVIFFEQFQLDRIVKFVNWLKSNVYPNKGIAELTQDVYETTLLTIKLLTLIFPVIGGICLSLSMHKIQNFLHLRRAKKSFKKHQGIFLMALEAYNSSEKSYQDFYRLCKKWDDEKDHIEGFTLIFTAYYTLGYEEGITKPDSPDKNAGLYTLVEKMRRKMVTKRTQNALRGITE